MKRGVFIVLLAGVLALGGCQTKKEAEEARITEAFENMGVEHEEVIKAVLSKKWNAVEPDDIYQTTGDTYEFTREGTGEFSGESFTYTCGFDDEHEIVLRIVMDDTKEEKTYFVRTDDTGYGLLPDGAGEEDVRLLQENMILLEMTDARAADIPGEWADKSDNRYILNKDRTLRMISKSGTETEGAYSLSEKKGEEGKLLLTMVFDGSVLDFQYELSEDGNTLTLSTPDVSHVWTKVS